MTLRTKIELKSEVDTLILDNTAGEISAADIRSIFTDIIDSLTITSGNVEVVDPDAPFVTSPDNVTILSGRTFVHELTAASPTGSGETGPFSFAVTGGADASLFDVVSDLDQTWLEFKADAVQSATPYVVGLTVTRGSLSSVQTISVNVAESLNVPSGQTVEMRSNWPAGYYTGNVSFLGVPTSSSVPASSAISTLYEDGVVKTFVDANAAVGSSQVVLTLTNATDSVSSPVTVDVKQGVGTPTVSTTIPDTTLDYDAVVDTVVATFDLTNPNPDTSEFVVSFVDVTAAAGYKLVRVSALQYQLQVESDITGQEGTNRSVEVQFNNTNGYPLAVVSDTVNFSVVAPVTEGSEIWGLNSNHPDSSGITFVDPNSSGSWTTSGELAIFDGVATARLEMRDPPWSAGADGTTTYNVVVVTTNSSNGTTAGGNSTGLKAGWDGESPTNWTDVTANGTHTFEFTPRVGSDQLRLYGYAGISGELHLSIKEKLTGTIPNNIPVITSNGGTASADIDLAASFNGTVTTVVATDDDVGDTLVYSLTGTDAASFAIDSGTGVLTTVGALGASNSYQIVANVTDATDTVSQTLNVTTDGTVGAPSLTSPANGSTLSDVSQLFQWNHGANVPATIKYDFWIGTTVGGREIYDSNALNDQNFVQVDDVLPSDGSTVYIQLRWTNDGTFNDTQTVDYTVTAHTIAAGGGGGDQGAGNHNIPNVTIDSAKVRYVTTSGSNSNDGLTEGTAWRTISYADGQAVPGTVIYVKAGTYNNELVVMNQAGTASDPVQLVGYKTTPGDGDNYQVVERATDEEDSVFKTHNASELPLIAGPNRAVNWGIQVTADHVIVRNFQINGYRGSVNVTSSNCYIDNVSSTDTGDLQDTYGGRGINLTSSSSFVEVTNCSVNNAGGEGFSEYGDDCTRAYCHCFCDDDSTGYGSATDYYGITNGSRNFIHHNLHKRIGDLTHGGVGFGVKGAGEYNVFEDNIAVNFKGDAFYARHRACRYNTFRRNKGYDGAGGFIGTRDGAEFNTFIDNECWNKGIGHTHFDAAEDGGLQSSSNNNTFYNNTFNDLTRTVVLYSSFSYSATTSTGDEFDGMVVNGAPRLFEVSHGPVTAVTMNGCTLNDIVNYATYTNGKGPSDLGVTFTNMTLNNCGFTLP